MSRLFLIAFIFCAVFISAQTPKKPHFVIHKTDNSTDVSKYERAVANVSLDCYRLYDKRRSIYFTDSKASIELYSAKELLELYGKQISPLTIKTESFTLISFDISMDGNSVKPQLIK